MVGVIGGMMIEGCYIDCKYAGMICMYFVLPALRARMNVVAPRMMKIAYSLVVLYVVLKIF